MTDQRARVACEGMYCPEFESDTCGFSLVAANNDMASHRALKSATGGHGAVYMNKDATRTA